MIASNWLIHIFKIKRRNFIMALLKESDLKYKYSWTTVDDDDPRLTGKPDSTLLNRHEGYEVFLVPKLRLGMPTLKLRLMFPPYQAELAHSQAR
jgi:hypothetical protein